MQKSIPSNNTEHFISYLHKRLEEGVPLSKLTQQDFQQTTGADVTFLTFRTYIGRARQGTGPTKWLSKEQRKRFLHLLDRQKPGGWKRRLEPAENRPAPAKTTHISTDGVSKTKKITDYLSAHPGVHRVKAAKALGFSIPPSTYYDAISRVKEGTSLPVKKSVHNQGPTIFQSIVSVEGSIDEGTYKLLESLVEGISKFTGNKFQVETTARPKPLIRINATVGK